MSDIAFNIQDELKVIGNYPQLNPKAPPAPKFNTPITPRDNIFRSLKGEALWAPCGGDFVTLCPKHIPDNVARGFVIDSLPFDNDTQAGGLDMFGVEWEWVKQVGGSMVRPGNPLKVPDITQWENYISFPNLSDYDWEENASVNKPLLNGGRASMLWCMNGLFERLISFMEFENAALAFVDDDEKEAVHRLFDKLCDFYDELFDYYKKFYDCDAIYFHDDWGSQRAPFFSRATAEEMLLPYLKRVADSAHKRGMLLDLHSCGKIELLVPVMIQAGVDVWSGQPMNDRLQVLKDHGGKIKLNFGPISGFGLSEEEILKQTDDFLDTYGPYINSIFVSAGFGANKAVYEKVYSYSRQAFAL